MATHPQANSIKRQQSSSHVPSISITDPQGSLGSSDRGDSLTQSHTWSEHERYLALHILFPEADKSNLSVEDAKVIQDLCSTATDWWKVGSTADGRERLMQAVANHLPVHPNPSSQERSHRDIVADTGLDAESLVELVQNNQLDARCSGRDSRFIASQRERFAGSSEAPPNVAQLRQEADTHVNLRWPVCKLYQSVVDGSSGNMPSGSLRETALALIIAHQGTFRRAVTGEERSNASLALELACENAVRREFRIPY